MTILAIDVGASGSRAMLSGSAESFVGPGLAVRGGRASYTSALDILSHLVRKSLAGRDGIDVVVLGAAGMIARAEPDAIVAELRTHWDAPHVVIASDAVTSLVGAWGAIGGAVVAAGTGVVALGTDLDKTWVRVDGWGPWIGDLGGGAWIASRALRAAARHADGRRGGSRQLYEASVLRFGSLRELSQSLRAADAPAILAGFVPDVVVAADRGDLTAKRILSTAAHHLAEAAHAVLAEPVPERVALVGGIAQIESIAAAWSDEMRVRRPSAEVAVAAGSSLSGAMRLGEEILSGRSIAAVSPFLHRSDRALSSHSFTKEQQ